MAPTPRSLWKREAAKVPVVVLTEDEATTLLESLYPLTLGDTEKGNLRTEVGKVRGDLRAELALGFNRKGLPHKKALELLAEVRDCGEHIVSETGRLGTLHEEVLARLERDGLWSDEDRERLLGDGLLLRAAAVKATEACREEPLLKGPAPELAERNAVERLAEIFRDVTGNEPSAHQHELTKSPRSPSFPAFVSASLHPEYRGEYPTKPPATWLLGVIREVVRDRLGLTCEQQARKLEERKKGVGRIVRDSTFGTPDPRARHE